MKQYNFSKCNNKNQVVIPTHLSKTICKSTFFIIISVHLYNNKCCRSVLWFMRVVFFHQ